MEKNNHPNNGLQLISIQSKIESELIDEKQLFKIDKFIEEKFGSQSGLAVFYLDFGVRFARWENKQLNFFHSDDKKQLHQYLQLVRIFNDSRELKIWKSDFHYGYRLRIDGEGESCDAIEADQLLWGTRIIDLKKGWIKLSEDRGTELIIPLAEKPSSQRVGIQTRNYIDYLSNGQASYVDCRFVELTIKKEKN